VFEGLLTVFLMVLVLWFALWLCILLPARMAEKLGRSQVGWVLLGLLFSPILACLLLWLLGNVPNSQT